MIEVNKFEVCAEMQKFRAILDKNNIKWEDCSQGGEFPITRTHFWFGKTLVSVINGLGTYGGLHLYTLGNEGLLEVMVGRGNPEGWLTAEGVVKRINECLGRRLIHL